MGGGAPDAAGLIADAQWFPVELDVAAGRWSFLRMRADVLERSVFLDDRLQADAGTLRMLDDRTVGAALAARGARADRPPAWLFHTSFCGSTLFARALHLPPLQVTLKEPLVLRRLADAQWRGIRTGTCLEHAVALLSRGWSAGGGVAVKPTHAALPLAAGLMRASPGSRALVLTSALEDFLVSNLKKPRESQAKVPELTERAMHGTRLPAHLPAAAFEPPDLLCAAALQWAGQCHRVDLLRAGVGADRVRVLRFDEWIRDVAGVVVEASQWLGLPASSAALRERADEVANRHAKAPGVEFGIRQRDAETDEVRRAYDAPLRRALEWAGRFVLPALRQAGARTGGAGPHDDV